MGVYNSGVPDQDLLIRAHINESHFGYSPTIGKHIEEARMHLYPDPDSRLLREEIAHFHQLSPEMVAVANGTDEIILMTAMAFLDSSAKALIAASSFPGYQTSAQACHASVCAMELDDYHVPIEKMAQSSREQKQVIFLCNPNNPTATVAEEKSIENLLNQASKSESLVVIDEAYAEYAGKNFSSAIDFVRKNKRLIVTRTFSKAYGLAGFRIGYAIGQADDIARIRVKQRAVPFCVNRLAQTAAIYALRDQEFLSSVVEKTHELKNFFYRTMEKLGISYVVSHTNFVLLKIKNSAEITNTLHRNFGILVRDTNAFGLPDHIRVSMLPLLDIKKLTNSLEYIINNNYRKIRCG